MCANHSCATNPLEPQRKEALQSITDAKGAVALAKKSGKNTTAAEALISQAEAAYAGKNYAAAKSFALNATSTAAGAPSSAATNATPQGSLPSPLSYILLAIIVIVLVGAWFAMRFGKGKGAPKAQVAKPPVPDTKGNIPELKPSSQVGSLDELEDPTEPKL